MWPDRVLNPGPLTYEPGVLRTALHKTGRVIINKKRGNSTKTRFLTGGFLLLRNFSVATSLSPHVCLILVLILISVFLR